MSYDTDERRGRRLLLALLALNLLLRAIAAFAGDWGYLTPLLVLLGAARLLPALVVLWGLYRGSWPALAVFCIQAVTGVGQLVGTLQFSGVSALNTDTALLGILLLAQATLLLAVFRHEEAALYWNARRARRRTRDLVLEIVLFLASGLLQYVPLWLLYGRFLF